MKKQLFYLSFLIAFVLSACDSSDSRIPEQGDTKSAFLSIRTSCNGTTGSRSDEPSASNTTATLYDALIYFLDGSSDPLIYDVLTAAESGADLTLQQLEEGVVIDEISTQITQVYIAGNYNSADEFGRYPEFPQNIGQRLSAVKNVLLDIQQVSYPQIGDTPTGDRLITVMDGQSALQEYTANDTGWTGTNTPEVGDMYANVTISPIVARIEIVEITYTGDLNFTLEGIYMNNVYQELPLSLDLTNRAPMNNGSNTDNYDVTNDAAFKYADYSTLYDLVEDRAAGSTAFTPANGTWAYQVFGDSAPVPHIILKLTGVTTAAGGEVADQYLTVTGYRDGNTEITALERNTIYKIANLSFTDDNLTLLPEPEEVNVWVHVEIEPWRTVNVSPII
ncbi:MAG: hypothetical protein LUD68_05480 [Rikenellaceae bacterium]|nr:hypothetical protein [Rikenellaceae bacterium]